MSPQRQLSMFLIFLCFLVYILQQFFAINIFVFSALTSFFPNVIFFAFAHGSILHIALNCFFLYSITRIVERKIPLNWYIIILLSGYLANVFVLRFFVLSPTLGISGILCAIIGFIAFSEYFIFKSTKHMTDILFIVIYTLIMSNVSIYGHFSGLLAGLVVAIIYSNMFKNGKIIHYH